jgi:hypothetical protein
MIPDVGAHLPELIDRFGLTGSIVTTVRWEGVTAVVFASPYAQEDERRRRFGLNELRDFELVEAALRDRDGFAVGAPAALRGQPRSSDDSATPGVPLLVDAVVIAGCDARSTVRRASYFAPVARRIALVHRCGDRDELLARATWLELGIAAVRDGQRLDVLAEPGPRHGTDAAYQWWFAEHVYGQHLRLAEAARRHPAHLTAEAAG